MENMLVQKLYALFLQGGGCTMKKTILALLAGLLTLVALSSAASACWAVLYQPEVPEALKK